MADVTKATIRATSAATLAPMTTVFQGPRTADIARPPAKAASASSTAAVTIQISGVIMQHLPDKAGQI